MIIYWLRKEFRKADNPAFFQAVKRSRETGEPLLVLFCLDDNILNPKNNIGFPRRYHLSKLLENFKINNSFFQIIHGSPENVFTELSKNQKIEVWANADIEPYSRFRDNQIYQMLKVQGSSITFLADQLTVSPETRSKEGNIYQVFTPFKNAVWQQFITSKVLPEPSLENLNFVSLDYNQFKIIDGENIQTQLWKILDTPWTLTYGSILTPDLVKQINLDEIMPRPSLESWFTTEKEAQQHAIEFITVQNNQINSLLNEYNNGRDNLSTNGTSKLSMALKWGLISSRWLVQQVIENLTLLNMEITNIGATTFVSELIWREFYRYILFHNPTVLDLEFQARFTKLNSNNQRVSNINWLKDNEAHSRFISWIKGETGYPLVDAGMNQISKTGWMHNRTRMVVASILTKNLGIDWRWGQDYFRSVLVDLDEASNNGGWQWAASTGSDPKPIRIFNPYLQAEKYDPKQIYCKKWLPSNYSILPIIEHTLARQQAMNRYGLSSDKN